VPARRPLRPFAKTSTVSAVKRAVRQFGCGFAVRGLCVKTNPVNLPNKLTASRFALTAAFLWAMFSRSAVNDTLALILFSLAGITDFLDGKIARDRKLITSFGTLMDPLADKIMVCSAFIALIERHMRAMLQGDLPPVFHWHDYAVYAKVEAW